MRAVLIARDLEDGRDWVRRQEEVQVVAILTPRSPHGARGVTGDYVEITRYALLDLSVQELRALLEEAAPSLAPPWSAPPEDEQQ